MAEDQEDLKGDALKERAAELDIEGRSSMNADELREAIAESEGNEGQTSGSDLASESEATAEEFTDPRQHDPNYFGPSGAATGMGAGDSVSPEAGSGIPEDEPRVTDKDGNAVGDTGATRESDQTA